MGLFGFVYLKRQSVVVLLWSQLTRRSTSSLSDASSLLQHTSWWGWTQTWGCSNGWAGWITERWAYSLRCWGWAEGVFSPAGILTWRLSKCGKADGCWRCREVGEAGSGDGREDRALDHFLKALHYSGSQCYKEIVTEIRFAKILMMCSSNQPWPDGAPASLWWV